MSIGCPRTGVGASCIERTFAWVDKFKRLLIRFERKDAYFKDWHFLVFFLINLHHILEPKV